VCESVCVRVASESSTCGGLCANMATCLCSGLACSSCAKLTSSLVLCVLAAAPPPSHARCPRSTHTLSGGLQLPGVQVSGPRRAWCYVELGRARGRDCALTPHLFTLPHNHPLPCPAPLCARSFLISGVFILILGMVFTSNGFQPGTFSYNAFTTLAAMFIVGSTVVFASLLVFEVRAVLRWSMHLSSLCRHSVYFPVLVDCTRRIFVIWGV
jgi:hypothetical protein